MTSYALVSNTTGKVQTFLRPDLPAGYTPPEGYTLVADDALPEGWQRETPTVTAHRVLKDTLIQRAKAAGKITELRAMISGLNDDQRFEWDNSSWFWSDNALIAGGVQSLGLDPGVILAPDPLAP